MTTPSRGHGTPNVSLEHTRLLTILGRLPHGIDGVTIFGIDERFWIAANRSTKWASNDQQCYREEN